MIKSAKNKMVGEEKEVKESRTGYVRGFEKYFYPDHQVTIEAASKEEADEIYKKKFNK